MSDKPRFSFQFKFPELLLVFLLLLSGISLAFSSGGFIINFSKIGFSIVTSVEKGFHTVTKGIGDTFGAVKQLGQLKKDYAELSKKVENYEEMQRSNADIRKENERLKEQLDFSVSITQKNYPAQIIARDIDALYASITINKGSVNGIEKNMPVVAYQNGNIGLVGKVVQVGPFTSNIMPVYNIDCVISARIQNTRDLGLVSGVGSPDEPLAMKYIKKRVLDQLHYGDIIVTSGENDNYMRDIPLGTISKISVLDYDSSLNIELTPVIDFSRLETVIVIDQQKQNDKVPLNIDSADTQPVVSGDSTAIQSVSGSAVIKRAPLPASKTVQKTANTQVQTTLSVPQTTVQVHPNSAQNKTPTAASVQITDAIKPLQTLPRQPVNNNTATDATVHVNEEVAQ